MSVGRRIIEIAAAMGLGIGAVATGFLLAGDDTSNEPTVVRTTSTLTVRETADPTTFLDLWERSRTGTYAVAGRLERINGTDVETLEVRRSRLGIRSLDQIGTSAIVTTEAGQQVCELVSAADVRCGAATASPSLGDERLQLASLFVDGGDYEVYPTADPTCVLVAARRPAGPGDRFGQQTEFCFDRQTGAIARSIESTGGQRSAFTATSISRRVTEEDLRPG